MLLPGAVVGSGRNSATNSQLAAALGHHVAVQLLAVAAPGRAERCHSRVCMGIKHSIMRGTCTCTCMAHAHLRHMHGTCMHTEDARVKGMPDRAEGATLVELEQVDNVDELCKDDILVARCRGLAPPPLSPGGS